jgi:hypothetical protein
MVLRWGTSTINSPNVPIAPSTKYTQKVLKVTHKGSRRQYKQFKPKGEGVVKGVGRLEYY